MSCSSLAKGRLVAKLAKADFLLGLGILSGMMQKQENWSGLFRWLSLNKASVRNQISVRFLSCLVFELSKTWLKRLRATSMSTNFFCLHYFPNNVPQNSNGFWKAGFSKAKSLGNSTSMEGTACGKGFLWSGEQLAGLGNRKKASWAKCAEGGAEQYQYLWRGKLHQTSWGHI